MWYGLWLEWQPQVCLDSTETATLVRSWHSLPRLPLLLHRSLRRLPASLTRTLVTPHHLTQSLLHLLPPINPCHLFLGEELQDSYLWLTSWFPAPLLPCHVLHRLLADHRFHSLHSSHQLEINLGRSLMNRLGIGGYYKGVKSKKVTRPPLQVFSG